MVRQLQTQVSQTDTRPDARADLGNLVAGKLHLIAAVLCWTRLLCAQMQSDGYEPLHRKLSRWH